MNTIQKLLIILCMSTTLSVKAMESYALYKNDEGYSAPLCQDQF